MKTIVVDKTLKEVTHHGTPAFPLIIYSDDFADFQEGFINWHWHKEVQFSLVLSGDIQFFVEGQIKTLKPGEAIFVNKNILHQIKPVQSRSGTMFSLVFDASFVGGDASALIEQKYIRALTDNPTLKHFCFAPEAGWQAQVISYLLEIYERYQRMDFGYELQLKGLLCLVWCTLVGEIQSQLGNTTAEQSPDDKRVKIAVQYILENYRDKITLGDIAGSIHLSKSECCRCFQRVIKMSPIEFVLQTRIYEAARLLGAKKQSITDVALGVGFSDVSYFGKVFRQQIGCSPSDYQDRVLDR